MFTGIQTRKVQKQFIITTASCTVCSMCKIVVKVAFYKRESGRNAVDEAKDYLYQEHRVAYCTEGFSVMGDA